MNKTNKRYTPLYYPSWSLEPKMRFKSDRQRRAVMSKLNPNIGGYHQGSHIRVSSPRGGYPIVASDDREFNLGKLATSGRLSPKLKEATSELIIALRNNDTKKIEDLSYLHQQISSGYGMEKEYPYNEDAEYNKKVTGTSAYHEFDMISHGDYNLGDIPKGNWEVQYPAHNKENSPIYANFKKSLWIQRAGKQLGSFDNFQNEKFPVIVQGTGGNEVEKKWFDDKKSANSYMKKYMKENK